jgi:hypothetical protein
MTTARCDSKIWSGACEHETYRTLGEKYLCDACGTIANLDHEVSRDEAVHISGDDHSLS